METLPQIRIDLFQHQRFIQNSWTVPYMRHRACSSGMVTLASERKGKLEVENYFHPRESFRRHSEVRRWRALTGSKHAGEQGNVTTHLELPPHPLCCQPFTLVPRITPFRSIPNPREHRWAKKTHITFPHAAFCHNQHLSPLVHLCREAWGLQARREGPQR